MTRKNLLTSIIPLLILIASLFLTGIFTVGCNGKKIKGKRKIAGIVFQNDQFFRVVLFGMRDAAMRNGAELFEANSNGKPDQEIQLVNTYIANGVDAIVISPLSAKASYTALSRAKEKGIAIIAYNTNVDGNLAASFIESDQFQLGASTGKLAREYIERKFGGKACVAILAAHSQVPEQSAARTNGFKSEIKTLPGVRIVAEQDAWLAEQAIKKVGDMLTAHPDIKVIWALNEGGTIGAVMAVKNAGKAGNIAVFGTDTNEQLADFLLSDDNILQAVTGQLPFEMGAQSVETALKVLNGESVEKKISLSGQLLCRDQPEEVMKFKQRLKELSK
ncbi:MAG: substrate-binding domain-containing protein [bacterium]